MKKHGARWTHGDWEQLRQLATRGEAVSQAAQCMGRTESSLQHAARRMLAAANIEADRSDAWMHLVRLADLQKLPTSPQPTSSPSISDGTNISATNTPSSTPTFEETGEPDDLGSMDPTGEGSPEQTHSSRDANTLRDVDIPLTLIDAISKLPQERMQHILLTRLGVSSRAETLAEIGAELHISRERVRQLQEKALSRLCNKGRREDGPASTLRRSLPIDEAAAGDTSALCTIVELVQSQFDCEPTLGLNILLRASGVPKSDAKRAAGDARAILTDERLKERARKRLVRTVKRLDARVSGWIEVCDWPTVLRSKYSTNRLASQRTPTSGLGHSGEFFSDKLQRSVLYESSLELDTLNILEKSEEVAYYLEQPTWLPYTLDARQRRYYPDIFVALRDGRAMFVEVKPLWQMALRVNQTKANAGRSFAHRHGYGWLVTDGRRTFRDLQQRKVPEEFEAAIDELLAKKRSIGWPDVLDLRSRTDFSSLDIAAHVVQNALHLELLPFRIWFE